MLNNIPSYISHTLTHELHATINLYGTNKEKLFDNQELKG